MPTSKNAPVQDLYERHGFSQRSDREGSGNDWTLDLSGGGIAYPEWLKIVSEVPSA